MGMVIRGGMEADASSLDPRGQRLYPTAMSQPIREEDVRHVAKLSRLKLSEEEISHHTGQLGAILGYIAKLNELDVEGVEPMAHPLDLTNVFREDEPEAGLANEVALRNAPDSGDGFFKVPKVLGDGGGA